uniref:thioesterase II family protein n=1 Tax=Streptomyces amakusaensis TaxID=67271 RepID=UPI0036D35263
MSTSTPPPSESPAHPDLDPSSWIKVFRPVPKPRFRLVCCPYLGASAGAFSPLSAAFPPSVEVLSVQYPGRRGSGPEPAAADIEELAGRIHDELRPWRESPPLAVLGHSMGAAVAFELTRALERGGGAPARLFVSGRPSPSAGLGLRPLETDDDLVDELRALGGVSPKLLGRPAFRRMILSVTRQDYRLNSAYLRPPGETVACPVTFLLSSDDPYVDRAAALAWKGHTEGDFRVAEFPGDHFFWTARTAEFVTAILEDLDC